MKPNYLKLCLVTQLTTENIQQYKSFILQAVQGGVSCVQLRQKNFSVAALYDMGLALKSLLAPLKIPLIINDHIDLAKEIDADGVHIGQGDLSPVIAREQMGSNKIIGWSVENLAQVRLANTLNCIDYIAASAVFASQSKTDCKTIWGLNGLQQVTQLAKHPVIAIGGIDHSNVASVMKNGACGVAVISAIHNHADPTQAAHDLIKQIDQGDCNVQ